MIIEELFKDDVEETDDKAVVMDFLKSLTRNKSLPMDIRDGAEEALTSFQAYCDDHAKEGDDASAKDDSWGE